MKEVLVIILAVIFVVAIGVVMIFLFFVPQRGTTSDDVPNQQIEQTGNNVRIQNYAYSPSTITVKVGDTVTWTNRDSVQHDVAGDGDFKGPLLRRGESYKYTFTEVGTYNYICTPHPYMTGTVVVEE